MQKPLFPFFRIDFRATLQAIELEAAGVRIRELEVELIQKKYELEQVQDRLYEFAEFLQKLEEVTGRKGLAEVRGAVLGLAQARTRYDEMAAENKRLRAQLPFARLAGRESEPDKGN